MPARVLHVHCSSAKGIKNTQYWGDQDPYINAVLHPSGAVRRSKPHTGGGVEPAWSAEEHQANLEFDVDSGDTHVRIELWNENTALDDLIGAVELQIASITATSQDEGNQVLPLDTGGDVSLVAFLSGTAEPDMTARRSSFLSDHALTANGDSFASDVPGGPDTRVVVVFRNLFHP